MVILPQSFFNDTATTEIYTLSLHDALPICNTKKGKYQISDLRKTNIPNQNTLKATKLEFI